MLDRNISKNQRRIQVRIKFLAFCFMAGFLVLSGKLIYLANISSSVSVEVTKVKNETFIRPNIFDRDGNLVASNIDMTSVAIRPYLLKNKEDVIENILDVIPSFEKEDLEFKILNDKKFVWLKRGITPGEKDKIHNLGIPGIQFFDEKKRFYSAGNTLANVVGYVDIDNNGRVGIEEYIDKRIEKSNFDDVYLSLDLEVTFAMRDELLKSIKKYSAKAGSAILMNVNNGEVIGLVSLPDYDPHYPQQALKPENANKVTNSLYEIGSTFKTFTIAMALDSGLVDLDTIYDAREPIKIGGHSIGDYHPENRELSVEEIFIYSSNIGSAKIVSDFGVDYHKSFLKKLGILDEKITEVGNIPRSIIPRDWKEINSITMSYGYGVSLTPLHAAVAGATVVNGGKLVEPTFIKSDIIKENNKQQFLDIVTSEKIKKLMYLNVIHGSAKKAAVDGILVGGKTGSSEKIVNGKYDPEARISTFMGVFPMESPEYILFLLLDEPQPLKETYGYATAGWNAAPTFSNIVTRIAPMLNIKPSNKIDLYRSDQFEIALN